MSEIPINATQLASEMDRSRSYVSAMKAGGYQFTHGTRTLLADALKWLRKNPDFRSTSYRAASRGRKHRLCLPPATVGTADEPIRSHD